MRRAAAALLLVACGDLEDARARWLRHTLVLDNQAFLERAPSLTAGKFALMSEHPFAFFRGTAPQYARDAMIAGGRAYVPTAYLDEDTRDVALVGDPHPENLGTYRTSDGRITLDFNDFDAATYGPYVFDVRRLALGFWVAGIDAERRAAPDATASTNDAVTLAAVDACVRAYAEDIALIADDRDAGLVVEAGEMSWGAIVDELFEDAADDGDTGEKLAEYTVLDGSSRTMLFGDLEPARVVTWGGFEQVVLSDSVREASEREEEVVAALVEMWRSTLHDPELAAGRLLGVSRRYGAGISSYPQLRFYALMDGPSEAVEDDVLLEIKETVDPVPLPGLVRFPDPGFGGNGERVVYMQRELQAFVDEDPYLGWAYAGAQSFRFRERTGYQRGFEVADLVGRLDAGDWSPEELVTFAAIAGRLLARSHGWARKQDGHTGAKPIAAAIGGDVEGFVAETHAFVDAYGPVVELDRRLLIGLIESFGFDLGYGAR